MTYITASSITKFLTCQRAYYYRYELGLVPVQTSEALSFGRAFHASMEAKNNGQSKDEAIRIGLTTLPDDEIQQATLIGLVTGYYHRYPENDYPTQPETRFEYRIKGVNMFRAAGVIDGLARKNDSEWILKEYKTTGSSIAPDSDYWDRLRHNIQLMNYLNALRKYKYNVTEINYDVTRKPAIRPKTNETAQQYADRLTADTIERPDFYYARRSVTILDDDVSSFEYDLYEICQQVRFLRSRSKDKIYVPELPWIRNVSQTACQSCEYKSFCLAGGVARRNEIPPGFEIGEKNPELNLKTQ